MFISNFTPVPRYNYRIGLPESGYYAELINTDSNNYWGSGIGNAGGVHTDDVPWHDQPYSANFTVPPLSTLILKCRRNKVLIEETKTKP